jgi:hypothetical protein
LSRTKLASQVKLIKLIQGDTWSGQLDSNQRPAVPKAD